jgi:hypothetical protein
MNRVRPNVSMFERRMRSLPMAVYMAPSEYFRLAAVARITRVLLLIVSRKAGWRASHVNPVLGTCFLAQANPFEVLSKTGPGNSPQHSRLRSLCGSRRSDF